MAVSLPSELDFLRWVVGSDWPDTDEDALRRCAAAWAAAATGLRELRPAAHLAGARAQAAVEGDIHDRFAEEWSRFTADGGALATLAGICDELAAACEHAASEVEYAKYLFIAALVALAIQIAALAAAMAGTFGASAAGIPVAIAATTLTVRVIAVRLVQALVLGAVSNVAIDAAAQLAQVVRNSRDGWDLAKTVRAAQDGALAGAIGGGLFLAGGRLVPDIMGTGSGRLGTAALSGAAGGVAAPLAHGELPTGTDLLLALTAGVAGGAGPDLIWSGGHGLPKAAEPSPFGPDPFGMDPFGMDPFGMVAATWAGPDPDRVAAHQAGGDLAGAAAPGRPPVGDSHSDPSAPPHPTVTLEGRRGSGLEYPDEQARTDGPGYEASARAALSAERVPGGQPQHEPGRAAVSAPAAAGGLGPGRDPAGLASGQAGATQILPTAVPGQVTAVPGQATVVAGRDLGDGVVPMPGARPPTPADLASVSVATVLTGPGQHHTGGPSPGPAPTQASDLTHEPPGGAPLEATEPGDGGVAVRAPRSLTDAQAVDLARANLYVTDAGLAFYPDGDELRDFAAAVAPTDDYVTVDLHGGPDGFEIDGQSISPAQFAAALRQLRDDAVFDLPAGVGIKLLSCETAVGVGGRDSPAAQLARLLEVVVVAPDQPVWTALDGEEIVSSATLVDGLWLPTEPPDGQWYAFAPSGTRIQLPAELAALGGAGADRSGTRRSQAAPRAPDGMAQP